MLDCLTTIAPPNITTQDIAIPLNNAPVSVRYREESSLSNRSISSVFNSWYIETLHSCIPEKGEGKSRLKEIAMLIFYAKRFLASDTTIEAKPCYSLRYISTYMHVHERTHVLRTHMMLRKI